MRTLVILSRKLSKALVVFQSEHEKRRPKAVSKAYEFIVQKLNASRKPKTKVQFLQQSSLLKYKEMYLENVRAADIDTTNE
ncbi:hypothetical protein OROMI_002381 [Orobanche minor]